MMETSLDFFDGVAKNRQLLNYQNYAFNSCNNTKAGCKNKG